MKREARVSEAEAEVIKAYRERVRDKYTDRRLHAVQLIGEGKRNCDVAEQLEVDKRQVSRWVGLFLKGGIEALVPTNKGGRPPKLSYEEEEALLNTFKEKAENGQLVEVNEIKTAYEAIVGTSKSHGQIYRVLHRHGWRKIKPRSRHPKKASPEAIDASKKLSEK